MSRLTSKNERLIKDKWIRHCKENVDRQSGRNQMGIYIPESEARPAGLCIIRGSIVSEIQKLPNDPALLAEKIVQLIPNRPVNADRVAVEMQGNGSTLIELLHDFGCRVHKVEQEAKPKYDDSYYNFRNLWSQIWWGLKVGIEHGEICLADVPEAVIEGLREMYYDRNDRDLVVHHPESEYPQVTALAYAWMAPSLQSDRYKII